MRWVRFRVFQSTVLVSILLVASLLSFVEAEPSQKLDDPAEDNWWDIDLGSYLGASMEQNGPNILHLGPVRFDPIDRTSLYQKLPSDVSNDLYLLQISCPSSIDAVLDTEGSLFWIVDIISSNTLLIQPIKGIDQVRNDLSKHARSIIPYHPLFKIENSLYDHIHLMDGEGSAPMVIGLYQYPGEDLRTFIDDISLGPIYLDEPSGLMEVVIPLSAVLNLVSFDEISHISLSSIEEPDNDVAADIIDVAEIVDTLGLNGTGQIVAVADGGLDSGSNSTLHQDFTGRVHRAYAYGRPGNWSDADIHTWDTSTGSWDFDGGHGTHVAGSVLGDGSASSGDYQGMAPSAKLVMQSTMTSTGSLSIPAYSRLYGDAYRSGARIQTNSWSTRGFYANYTWRSWQTDHFIWNNPDFLVLFSSGNRGSSGSYQVSTQASSKNVIAVGASENYRPTLGGSSDNISHMADFSSRGPTWGDQRIKPDVVAPGTWILSTRSMLIPDRSKHYWGSNSTYSGVNDNYAYNGGTSMSTPIVAGMTTLIRQYYDDKEDIDPSASLLKATVINGARPLNGQWSSIPNKNEGWGRVNLSNSLGVPGSDAGVMRYIDNSSGLTTGTTHSRLYTVASSSNDLVITLVWTDYPGSNTSSTKLLNDLDLKVTAPNGTVMNGNDFLSPYNSARDSVNNVERVVIPNPRTGVYKVNVSGFSVIKGPQPYSVVISGNLSDAVGWMEWEEKFVPANGTSTNLILSDSNLTGDGWININVNSSSDQTGEIINLTEIQKSGVGIGLFTGSIKIVTGTPNVGEVSVVGDEYITAKYSDQYPAKTVEARMMALLNPKILNVSHDALGRILTYTDKVIVIINGTSGWTSWFDVEGLSGRHNIDTFDNGISPDQVAGDGEYTGEFLVPNLVQGNFTIKGYISRPELDPATLGSDDPVRINTNIPRKPRNLTASVVDRGNSLRLDWDSPGDINLMSYIIQRAPESGSGTSMPGSFSDVGATSFNRTYFIDDGLTDGELYFYKISSFNVLGYRSEPSPSVSAVPFDSVAPWFDLSAPTHQTVITGIVEFQHTSENDSVQVVFEIAEDRNNDMIPDGSWSEILIDDTPQDPSSWDTDIRPSGIDEGDWFILRARVKDEVDNWNISGSLARYSIDNTPPAFLDISSEMELAVNVSVYHLTGTTEPEANVTILQDGSTIRFTIADGNGDFDAYLGLEVGVNEFSIESHDEYGNGPTGSISDLYVVYDPYEPQIDILPVEPVTSSPFMLDGSGSSDIGPVSRLSGVWNYSWVVDFWDEISIFYGVSPSVHLSRPGTAVVKLVIRDAAYNWNTTTIEILIADDLKPIVSKVDDFNVFEDSNVELRIPDIVDNDPEIKTIGNFTWTFSGPETFVIYGNNINFQFTTPGQYQGVLEAADSGGNSGSSSFNVTVVDITNPVVDAGSDVTVIKGRSVEFSGFNTSDNHPDFPSGANFTWIFKGPDLVIYGMNISVRLGDLGDYRVRLKVSDAAGNTQTEEIMLHIITDGIPPMISKTDPHPDAGPVSPTKDFIIKFDERIDEDTLEDGIFLIGPTGLPIPILIQRYYADPLLMFRFPGNQFVVKPDVDLDLGKLYTLRITSGLKDITGEPAELREFEYQVVPEMILLQLNGKNAAVIESNGLTHNISDLEIIVEFSSSVSLGMKLILENENGISSNIFGLPNGSTMVFTLKDLEPGTFNISFNGTSEFGVYLKDDRSFTLVIEEETTKDPISDNEVDLPWWVFVIVGSVILLIILLVAILLIVKKKKSVGDNVSETQPSQTPPPHQHIRPIPPPGQFGR